MEKIIYLLGRPASEHLAAFNESLLSEVISSIRSAGGVQIAVHLVDQDEQVRSRAPQRMIGPWDTFGGAISFWLPSEHLRKPVEALLETLADSVHGYLVTEAVWQKMEQTIRSGERRSGICLLGCIGKKPGLSDEEYFAIWEQHSHNSFKLHPHRQSYSRHTVARCLTEGAPDYRGIILEHFPDLDVFTDDRKFFNVQEARRINMHALTMIDQNCFISGGVSEYLFT